MIEKGKRNEQRQKYKSKVIITTIVYYNEAKASEEMFNRRKEESLRKVEKVAIVVFPHLYSTRGRRHLRQ